MKTRLFLADVSPLEDEKLYEACRSLMPEARKAKTDRLKFERDRRLSVGAWLVLMRGVYLAEERREAFPDFVRDFSDRYPVEIGPAGKPDFRDASLGHFSISHSGTHVLAAVSPFVCGCDLEERRGRNGGIADRFFHEAEKNRLDRETSPEKKEDLFFRIWTGKESLVKADGRGFGIAPDSYSVVSPRGGFLSSAAFWGHRFRTYRFLPEKDLFCALCLKDCGDLPRPRLTRVDPVKIAEKAGASEEKAR